MTGTPHVNRILGTLSVVDGKGSARLQERYDTDIADLWSALTEPERLARWLGDVSGDLRVGGRFGAHFVATGWQGTGQVDECRPPTRLAVRTVDADSSEEHVIEVGLTSDGDSTLLTVEERGMPLDQIAAYGAGLQVHLEDLAAVLVGGDRHDARSRWQQLLPGYQDRAPAGG